MESNNDGVLIIGGAGFVGKALIRKVIESKFPLVSLDIVGKPVTLPPQNENFKWIKFSYLDALERKNELADIVNNNNIKTVIHLATTMFPVESKKQIERDCLENVYANVCLFKILFELGCDRIIFASSGGTVYGQSERPFIEDDKLNPNVSYGLSKATTESYLDFLAKEFGKKAISMRISNPYGEEQNIEGNQGVIPIFLNRISRNIPLSIIGSLDSKRDYIYIDDLVSAFMTALNYNGEETVFNIGSGESISLRELIETLESKLKTKAIIEANDSIELNSNGVTLNVQKAQKEFNWEAKVSLTEGIENLVNFHGLGINE